MRGHIRQRGARSWELKFDAGRDPATGKRKIQYHSFKGSKRDAQTKLAELIASVGKQTYVEPNKVTVADFVRQRVDAWENAPEGITARTAARYRQLVENQIVPPLGDKPMQKLSRLDIEGWHATLNKTGRANGEGGVSARTIGHAHRVLSKALDDAERDGLVAKNVCKLRKAPKVADKEMVIVHDVPGFVEKIRGGRLFVIATLGLFAGMRLGEILALRDRSVDFDRGVVKVREALEETVAKGVVFKAPKSRAGRRDITLPEIALTALREHRRSLLELRMKLGAGKMPDDALLFSNLDGGPLRPSTISSDWGEEADRIGMPDLTFHALRHSHASQLIDRGVDIVTISKRLGHAKPSVTLAIYAHLFRTDDTKAAVAINEALAVVS